MGERIGAHNMNNMGKKRIQANFIVVLVLILILAACEGKNAGSGPQGSKSSAVSVQTEVEGKQPAEPAEEAEGVVEPAAEPGGEEEGAAGSAADVSQEADVKEGTDAQSADIASGDSYSVAAADEDQGLVLDSKAAPAAEPPVREPAITKQPAEAVVKEGGTAVFKVSAEGDGLKYRWQARKPGDEKWRNTEAGDGLETPVLTVPNVNTGRNRFRYRCRITDEHGKTIYTDGVFLYVLGIRSSPKNQKVLRRGLEEVIGGGLRDSCPEGLEYARRAQRLPLPLQDLRFSGEQDLQQGRRPVRAGDQDRSLHPVCQTGGHGSL